MGNEIEKWADPAMFEAAPMKNEPGSVKVVLLSATPDPLGAVAAFHRMYEGKPTLDLGRLTDEERLRCWSEVNKTHLAAPLEAIDLHFFVEGVTRSVTHQMVRQRTAVYAQESLRFAVKNDLRETVPLPPSLHGAKLDAVARVIWENAIGAAEDAYRGLVAAGVPAEDARGLLPHATPTRLNYKTNLRMLLQHLGDRLCTQAQFEWRQLGFGYVRAMKEHRGVYTRNGENVWGSEEADSSWQWREIAKVNLDTGAFAPVCYRLRHCPWGAELDRTCTIRERVQAGRFEDIDPAEWLLDNAAARRGEKP